MKRFLAFLLLLVAGLGVLLWIDRHTRTVEPLPEPEIAPAPPPPPDEIVKLPDGEGGVTEIRTGGAIDAVEVDPQTRLPLYELHVRDHRAIGEGAYDADGVQLSLFDGRSQAPERQFRSAFARLRLSLTGTALGLDPEHPVTLQEVDAEQASGLEFAPLSMQVPVLELVLGERKMRSEREVTLSGRGLSARGTGLFVDGLARTLRLEREPHVELELQHDRRATLDAGGPLSITDRPDLGPGMVEIEAQGGARLDLPGEHALSLQALTLSLRGEVLHDPDRFRPTALSAEGEVRLEPEEGVFLGQRGTLAFAADGRPQRATLEGSPQIELELEGLDLQALQPPSERSASVPARARGEGTLVVELDAAERFELGGPARLELPSIQATLDSAGTISGLREGGRRYATFSASDDVRVAIPSQNATLEADALDVEALPAAAGEVFVRMTAHGSTHATGARPERGQAYDLTAREGLVYVSHGQRVEVPRADGVELAVTGRNAFRARAERVRDFLVDELSFDADGDVHLESAQGSGAGARLEVRGPERAVLFGDGRSNAHVDLDEGVLSAARIELAPERMFAEGDVRAHFTRAAERVELRSRWLGLARAAAGEGGLDLDAEGDWVLDAGGATRAQVTYAGHTHDLSADLLRLVAKESRDAAGRRTLDPRRLSAVGHVEAAWHGDFEARARGERLEVSADGDARLSPAQGERVHVSGALGPEDLELELDADEIVYGTQSLRASAAVLDVRGLDLSMFGAAEADPDASVRASAQGLILERTSLILSGDARVESVVEGAESWFLDAKHIQLVQDSGQVGNPNAPVPPPALGRSADGPDKLYAWGGFRARGRDGLVLTGERLQASRSQGRVFTTGSPATLEARSMAWSSDWFELDSLRRSIKSGAGEVAALGQDGATTWHASYTSLEPIEGPDTTIQVLRELQLHGDRGDLRAALAILWIDPRRWTLAGGQQAAPEGAPSLPGEERARPRMHSLFGSLDRLQELDWLREAYLEGNIEYSVEGDVRARAESIYLDLVDGHGWVRRADLSEQMPNTSRRLPIKLRAEWLRHSADGSYQAENAVATSCDFEVPHYVVRIGRVSIEPRTRPHVVRDPGSGEEHIEERFDGWSLKALGNRLAVWGEFGLPLPKINIGFDDRGRIDTDSVSVFGLRPFSFGNDAKFGTFVGTTFSIDFSWLARAFDRLFGGKGRLPSVESGNADVDARWLNNRGLLLGLSLPLRSPGRYSIDLMIDGLFDRGRDKGLVQVPKDDRSDWRGWYHARGRFFLGPGEWLDTVATYQSDAGVQSEFFEGDFLRFEERETFLHWRRAEGDTYAAATAEARLEDFRTEVLEQPSVLFSDGRSKVGEVAGLPVIVGSRTTLGYYSLETGSGPFEPPPSNWPGERDVLRFDTDHRVETNASLGWAGLRATSYLEGRFTAWDQSLVDKDQQPARAAVLAGAELSTSFYRVFAGGQRHVWTPRVGVHADLASVDDDVPLVPIDATEEALQGRFVDLGLRSLWINPRHEDTLDVELTTSYGADLPGGAPDQWRDLGARSLWLSSWLGVPYVVSHDGRYDVQDGETDYSRSLLGFRPIEPLDIEIGYSFGRDADPVSAEFGQPLFDAATFGARYRFSSKWEVEGKQTLSNTGEGRLASSLLLRRIGHDFVFEVDTRFVAGEGTSFGFKILPLILWRSTGFSLLDRYRRQAE